MDLHDLMIDPTLLNIVRKFIRSRTITTGPIQQQISSSQSIDGSPSLLLKKLLHVLQDDGVVLVSEERRNGRIDWKTVKLISFESDLLPFLFQHTRPLIADFFSNQHMCLLENDLFQREKLKETILRSIKNHFFGNDQLLSRVPDWKWMAMISFYIADLLLDGIIES